MADPLNPSSLIHGIPTFSYPEPTLVAGQPQPLILRPRQPSMGASPGCGRVADKRVLKLIRAFLNAGLMEDGLVRPLDEGTPQGGPLSPLLSNLVANDLDKEMERPGHRFSPSAHDCNTYVRSRRAGERSWPP